MSDKVGFHKRQRDELKVELVYLQSQSMRNNLIFYNIEESVDETYEMSEKKVREFIHQKFRVAEDVIEKMQFERVH